MCVHKMRLFQHADGAKRDTIGQGQAIQRQALSGVLGKILSRKDAIAMRYTAARAEIGAPLCTCLLVRSYVQ